MFERQAFSKSTLLCVLMLFGWGIWRMRCRELHYCETGYVVWSDRARCGQKRRANRHAIKIEPVVFFPNSEKETEMVLAIADLLIVFVLLAATHAHTSPIVVDEVPTKLGVLTRQGPYRHKSKRALALREEHSPIRSFENIRRNKLLTQCINLYHFRRPTCFFMEKSCAWTAAECCDHRTITGKSHQSRTIRFSLCPLKCALRTLNMR